MKVGILNVQWLNNLGSVLLAYAVQKKLDEIGFENAIETKRGLGYILL